MRTRTRRSSATTALALVAFGAATIAGGQTKPTPSNSPPTFRSSIEAVQVDVYVTDAAGNPVSGLTAGDFEIFENGKPRPIATFEAGHIPIERAESLSRTLAEPDVLTNEGPPGRVYLFALDEVGHDQDKSANILRTRRFVRQFIEDHFGPHDVGAVALLGRGLATDGQDFTNNRRLLLDAVDKFSGGFAESRPTNQCAKDLKPGSVRRGEGQGIGTDRSQQIVALRSLTEAMSRVPGRHKALVVFSECFDVDVLDLVDYNGGVLYDNAPAGQQATAVRLDTELRALDGTAIALASGVQATINDAGRHAFAVRLPLSSVPPGAYALRVRARSSARDEDVEREIPFRVRQR